MLTALKGHSWSQGLRLLHDYVAVVQPTSIINHIMSTLLRPRSDLRPIQ